MKILWKIIVIISAVIIIAYGLLYLFGRAMFSSTPEDHKDSLYSELNVPTDAIIIRETNDLAYRGGEYYGVLQIPSTEVQDFIATAEQTGEWRQLPLPEKIKETAILPDNFPVDLDEGIYYFVDMYAESYPDEKDININLREYYSFKLAVFNTEDGVLYIYYCAE